MQLAVAVTSKNRGRQRITCIWHAEVLRHSRADNYRAVYHDEARLRAPSSQASRSSCTYIQGKTAFLRPRRTLPVDISKGDASQLSRIAPISGETASTQHVENRSFSEVAQHGRASCSRPSTSVTRFSRKGTRLSTTSVALWKVAKHSLWLELPPKERQTHGHHAHRIVRIRAWACSVRHDG